MRLLICALCTAGQLGGEIAGPADRAAAGGGRPNVVIVYADDLAERALDGFGALAPTPNIDRLAASGVRFVNSFVGNSICGPARASLLTGLHSHANGQTTNRPGFRRELPTFATALQTGGYQTAVVGKWHLPGDPVGFDHWRLSQGSYFGAGLRGPGGVEPHEGYATDTILGEALRWMEEDRDEERPFLLWISHVAAHRTWMPAPRHLRLFETLALPEPRTLFDDFAGRSSAAPAAQMRIANDLFPAYDLKLPISGEGILDDAAERLRGRMGPGERDAWESAYAPRNRAFAQAGLAGEALVHWKYQRYVKDYLRCVAAIDEGLGRLLDHLDQSGLARDTVVIFTSDQGFFLGEHGWYDKRWMYEPALRTPLMLRWPGMDAPGSVRTELVQNIDIAPTLCELGGVAPLPGIHGRSLLPLLGAGADPDWRDAIYYHYQQRDSGRTSHTVAPHYGVRTARHKLIYLYDTREWELFDLVDDPEELVNLAGEAAHVALFDDLKRRLAELRLEFGDRSGPDF